MAAIQVTAGCREFPLTSMLKSLAHGCPDSPYGREPAHGLNALAIPSLTGNFLARTSSPALHHAVSQNPTETRALPRAIDRYPGKVALRHSLKILPNALLRSRGSGASGAGIDR